MMGVFYKILSFFNSKEIVTSTIAVVTLTGTLGFFIAVAYIFRNDAAIIDRIITIMQSIATLILAYYFGTSKSSSEKNHTIATLLTENVKNKSSNEVEK